MKTSLKEQSDAYGEGEMTCFAHIVRQHKHDNCLFLSNDTDYILYALLAGATRERDNKTIMSEWWLEITLTHKKSGLGGTKQNKISEYWDINNLIHTIEEKLPSLEYPVRKIVVVYLTAGSDFTEKWYNKSYSTFLKTFPTQVQYVKDVVNKSDYTLLNSHA